jgi:hypothetical protein
MQVQRQQVLMQMWALILNPTTLLVLHWNQQLRMDLYKDDITITLSFKHPRLVLDNNDGMSRVHDQMTDSLLTKCTFFLFFKSFFCVNTFDSGVLFS